MNEKIRINMPRQEAIALIESMAPKMEAEEIGLLDSCGRVAACDITSCVNMPSVACSMWDGISFSYAQYAACGGDVSAWLPERDYRFTNTGIPIGDDRFDTMVMIEQCDLDEAGHVIAIRQPDIKQGQNVTHPGDKIALGEVLVPQNTEITPSHMNLLASGQVRTVKVYRKPLVGIVVTGNELVSYDQPCSPQQTIDSNSVSMAAKIRLWGGRPLVYPIVADSEANISAALLEACANCDIVVIGGGSGRGQRDLLQNTVSSIGRLFFSSVEHGPAKRTCFAQVNGKPVIGLVGPPGGEEMSFDFYVLPAVKASLHQFWRPTMVMAMLDEDVPVHHRTDFQFTVKLYTNEAGKLCAHPLPHAKIDRNIALHDGYIFVRKSSGGIKKGQLISVELRTGREHY